MTVMIRFVRDRARATAWWILGMVGLVLFTVAFFPSVKGQEGFDQVFRQLPEAVKSFIGSSELSITTAPGYLNARLFSTLFPATVLIFGIGLGARAIGGSEDDGTLELLLSNPVTRLRVFVQRYVASIAMLLLLVAAFAASLILLSPPFGLSEEVSVADVIYACIAVLCMAIFHMSLSYGTGSLTGRRGVALGLAAAVAVSGYLIHGIAGVSEAARPLRFASPWYWALNQNALTEGLGLQSVLLPLGMSLFVVLMGGWAFLGRDLR